jgi:uncharacterized membrane protein YbaN (DUF454 family)
MPGAGSGIFNRGSTISTVTEERPGADMRQNSAVSPVPTPSRTQRWLFAALGVVCVGLGAVGVFIPGLPTTVFLIAASWLFTRSCPWLEERLIRVPLFRPFLGALQPGARMPRRAAITSLVVMWIAITCSAMLLAAAGGGGVAAAAVVVAAGVVGSVFIVRLSREPIAELESDAHD